MDPGSGLTVSRSVYRCPGLTTLSSGTLIGDGLVSELDVSGDKDGGKLGERLGDNGLGLEKVPPLVKLSGYWY